MMSSALGVGRVGGRLTTPTMPHMDARLTDPVAVRVRVR